jgi:predicted DNA-binding transcriptional regulator YafY
VLETSARLLALLGLLQSRPQWSAAELAARLDVTERTVRNDVARLRELDYPVDTVRGRTGGYRLGRHGRMPPLLLSDDEAVAVALGLTVVPGLEGSSAQALAKLEQILPDRVRRRVAALSRSTEAGPANTSTNVEDPDVDPALLAEVATAIHAHEALRFRYAGDERVTAEPYRLVSWQQRWYVVGRVPDDDTWRPFRLDWMRLRTPGGGRFRPQPLAGGDYTAFVLREVAAAGWAVHARIAVDAPAEEVLRRINPAVGVVETVDDQHCVLVTGADSIEVVAVYIGMLGLDFHVTEPPALVDELRTLSERYARALPPPG